MSKVKNDSVTVFFTICTAMVFGLIYSHSPFHKYCCQCFYLIFYLSFEVDLTFFLDLMYYFYHGNACISS